MSQTTSRLALPLIAPDQAQKHITHNEAIARLDGLMQPAVTAVLASPPPDPVEGALYLVDAAPGGEFAGKAGQLAHRLNGAWDFILPLIGWIAWFADIARPRILTAAGWKSLDSVLDWQTPALGIGTGPDPQNPLSVRSATSLFNHAGAGHQLKINKAGTAGAASLLLQDNFSGRAEMVLTAANAFQLRSSPEGVNFNTAVDIQPSGVVSFPKRPLCRASYGEADLPRNGSLYLGYNQLTVNQGGWTLAPGPAGIQGQALVVPQSGLYFIHQQLQSTNALQHSLTLVRNGVATPLVVRELDATSSNGLQVSMATLMTLQAGDTLCLGWGSNGNPTLNSGQGKTETILMMQ